MADEEARLFRAQALLDRGRVEAARDLIVAVLATAPTNPRALCLLACSHDASANHAEMLAAAERAVAAAPDDEWAHRLRAVALLHLDRPAEAERSAREAVRLAPHLWQGQVALAGALADVGRRRRAAFAAARRAVALAPNEAETHYAQGVLRHHVGLSWWARRAYRRALECDPHHAGALTRLGQIDARDGRVAAAVRHFQAAAQAAPGAVDLVTPVDDVVLRLPTGAVVVTLPVGLALTFGVHPLAWVLAAAFAAMYALRVAWVYRRLPAAVRSVVWSRLRDDVRYKVRVRCAAGNLAVAIGVGVVSALSMTRHDPDPVVLLWLLGAVIVAFIITAVAVRLTDWFASGRTQARPAGGPAQLDDPEAATGTGKYLVFRWFRVACLLAFAMVAAGGLEESWPRRASYGGVALAVFALFTWLRRPRRPTWRDRLWERSPDVLSSVFGIGILVTLGSVVSCAAMPSTHNNVQLLFLTFTFLFLAGAVVTQLVWWLVQLTYGVRLLRARAAVTTSEEAPRA